MQISVKRVQTKLHIFFGHSFASLEAATKKVPQWNIAVESTVFLCRIMEVSGSDLGSELNYYIGVRDLFQPSDKMPGNTSISNKPLPSTLLSIHYSLTGL